MKEELRVPFWNPSRHFRVLEEEVVPEMLAALRSGDLVMRHQMRDFEHAFAAMIGRRHGVGVSNCTDGLRLTLEALSIGPGSEVITPAHTFVATVAAIHHVGAEPVLVDVGWDHLMDPVRVEEAVSERSAAIIPVHLNGRTCEMDRLGAIARRHNLLIIEDAAQAVQARFQGQMAGSFGVAAAYSFYPAKLLGAFGDGGAVVTDSDDLNERMLLLRDHGRTTNKVDLDRWGWNCRLDNLQAVVLSVKLRHIKDWVERRREIAAYYEHCLADVEPVVAPPPPTQDGPWYDVYQNYVIEVERREELREHLRLRGVETLVSWPRPVHRQASLELGRFELPTTDWLSGRVLSLPMYPELTEAELAHVVASVHAFY